MNGDALTSAYDIGDALGKGDRDRSWTRSIGGLDPRYILAGPHER